MSAPRCLESAGDPFDGSSFVPTAPRASQAYSATVNTVNAVPEPATAGVVALSVLLFLVIGAVRRRGEPLHLASR